MKKWVKILLYNLLAFVLIVLIAAGYFYYQFSAKYQINEEKYAHNIGYLPMDTESSTFKLCNKDHLVGWFANANLYVPIFKGSKTTFKKFILKNFQVSDQADNGFLNLRFIINCKGEVGSMEVNELDTNYTPTELSQTLVKQLVEFSSRKENWNISNIDGENLDSYMYLIYKIENGEISEILP